MSHGAGRDGLPAASLTQALSAPSDRRGVACRATSCIAERHTWRVEWESDLSRARGAVLAVAVMVGFFLLTGVLGSLSSTTTGVFWIVGVLAVSLVLIEWYSKRRKR